MQELERRPPEIRTWEPPTVKIDPITSLRPSNRQLAIQGNQLHQCLESHKTDTTREFRHLKRDVQEMKDALGVGQKKQRVATQSTMAAFWRTVMATTSSITAVGIIYRSVQVFGPSIKVATLALLHAMATGRL
jgi:hypothetical protein